MLIEKYNEKQKKAVEVLETGYDIFLTEKTETGKKKLINGIELNAEQKTAIMLILQGKNVCLLGSAGTGKTATIQEACKILTKMGKQVKKVSLYGLAAQLVGGITIHSAFNIPLKLKGFIPSKQNVRRIGCTDVLIVDEISIVNKSMFDIIGKCLSFYEGKMQIVVVGDFYQLEPICNGDNSEFAFESDYWKILNFSVCILKKIVRQDNPEYISNLQKVRVGDKSSFRYFMTHMNRHWMEDAIAICTHCQDADEINERKISALIGNESKVYCANYEGEIDKNLLQGEKTLTIKTGMRVMTTLNSNEGYQNGSMGEVVGFDEDNISVRFDYDGQIHKIGWVRVKMNRTDRDETTDVVFMPLRPAYAITIHKSQGQTFDKVNIVIGQRKVFAHGQLYVALTRCRSIENTHIKGNLCGCKIEPNPKVLAFYNRMA